MARRKSRFIVGLFVTLGLVIGTAAIVWLGASRYFEAGIHYVTYFDESVQGLQVDSRVKYRGVDIGKVERIGVAPDQKLVEVVMKVDLAGDVQKDIVTQLRAAGITGIVFIELDHRQPGHQTLMPPVSFSAPYPVIPSQPSQTKLILSSADRIMERLEKVDLAGISDHVKGSARAIETFFSDRRLGGLIVRIEATAAALESNLVRIDTILAAGKIEALLEEGKAGLAEGRLGLGEARQGIAEINRLAGEGRALVADVRTEIQGLKAGERVERIERFVEKLDHRTRRVADDLEMTTEDIRQAVESLRGLLERLRENPSDLIFSRPRTGEETGEEK
jgi:phospholipid/cholesterol/gamma-HCH transport system substrate-binding protein